MQYCMYLRKSRADVEAESRGELETLARHEATLLELAKRRNLSITKIFKEVVSGESIAARPVMQQLLSEIEKGCWDGVLVMEVERLARGDTIDQGIIAQTFKFSNTKIITPVKDYNPNNEFDEEYFEFGLFMSRREYKTINRRLQNGRIASIKEGKFVGNKRPYGYERVKIPHDKGFTLKVVPDEAEVVKLIFNLYVYGETVDGEHKDMGMSLIARRLNDLGIPSLTGAKWTLPSISGILTNPVYVGKIRWNSRKTVKQMENGVIKKIRPRSRPEDCLIVDGLHQPIIRQELFDKAQHKKNLKEHKPIQKNNSIQNPLASLVVCGDCGRRMTRRPYYNDYPDTLMCPATKQLCKTVSSPLDLVEKRTLAALKEWLNNYKLSWEEQKPIEIVDLLEVKKKQLTKCETDLSTVEQQIGKAYDLLEQGIYDTTVFLKRSQELAERKEQLQQEITTLKSEINNSQKVVDNITTIIPRIENLLEVYDSLESPKAKNELLSEVIEKIVYKKETGGRWHGSPDDFTLTLYPKLPTDLL